MVTAIPTSSSNDHETILLLEGIPDCIEEMQSMVADELLRDFPFPCFEI